MSIKIKGLDNQTIKSIGIGVFDGLHMGHQALFKHCDYLLTFDPHPDILLKKQANLKLLTTQTELQYLTKTLLSLDFTIDIAKLPPLDFLNHVIRDKIKPQKIVVGYDFRFGNAKKGTNELLKKWGKENHIVVIEVPAQLDPQGQPIKSAIIRKKIQSTTEFQSAIADLGHPYLMIGHVIHGDKRGKSLGFATANLAVPTIKLIPANGVYKGYVEINNQNKTCAIYIGTKPSFDGKAQSIEIHIPDFEANLYDQALTVFIEKKIRDELKFESKTALIKQIEKDLQHL